MITRENQLARLNEPPEPSPGLSAAMPWDRVRQNLRPERAREAWKKSERLVLNSGGPRNERFSRPFRAASLLAFQSQGIALGCEALRWALMAFQVITLADYHANF